MKHAKVVRPILGVVAVLIFLACETTRRRAADDNSRSEVSNSIAPMAVLPVRNLQQLDPSINLQLNLQVGQAIQLSNPTLRILDPVKASTLLKESNLDRDYDDHLDAFARSGIPNVETLQRIGKALDVDAVLQEQVLGLSPDGTLISLNAATEIYLRYSIVSTRDGRVLWKRSAAIDNSRDRDLRSNAAIGLTLPNATRSIIRDISRFAFVRRSPRA